VRRPWFPSFRLLCLLILCLVVGTTGERDFVVAELGYRMSFRRGVSGGGWWCGVFVLEVLREEGFIKRWTWEKKRKR
jgi:hypothetical protein